MLNGAYVESAEAAGLEGMGVGVGVEDGAGVAVGLVAITEDCVGKAVK